jgi:electron transfer flavoprotein alpha subunit
MSRVLVIAEHDGATLAPATAAVVTAAARVGRPVDVAVVSGPQQTRLAEAAARIEGVARVQSLEHEANSPYLAAVWAPQVAALAGDYSHVFAPATTFGKDLLPRVAGLLGTGMLSDVTAIEGTYEFLRPIYAGNAIVRVAAQPDCTLLATIRSTAFAAAVQLQQPAADILHPPCAIELPTHTRSVEGEARAESGPDLQTATRVVAGGRGLGSAEAFGRLAQLAETLGAAIGASRAAVDAGWAPNELQVGQTGKIVAPDLYIAVGISGAIQHLTGIKDSGTIVAINNDPDAPICSAADVVLVGDLFEILPALTDRLAARRT